VSEFACTGLDGSNPLGFLAALGVLEALSERGVPVRLAWRDDGVWRPVFTGTDAAIDQVIDWLDADRETCASDPALHLEYDGARDLKPPPERFRAYLLDLVGRASPAARRSVDWAACFASDVVVDNNGNTKPTALHFTAGQQQFLKMVLELAAGVNRDDIREALVGPWRYARPLPVMGFDATAGRDYALRASDPSGDKKRGVPGADWLAVRGLAGLGVVPNGDRLLTTCCSGGWKTGSFRWPLWHVALDRPMVHTVLRLSPADMPSAERRARGIAMVLECGIRRSEQGGYGSMTPAAVR
jgi:hypothetical protein